MGFLPNPFYFNPFILFLCLFLSRLKTRAMLLRQSAVRASRQIGKIYSHTPTAPRDAHLAPARGCSPGDDIGISRRSRKWTLFWSSNGWRRIAHKRCGAAEEG